MKTTNGMIDNMSLNENEKVERAKEALYYVLHDRRKRKVPTIVSYRVAGLDEDTEDVLFFFKFSDFLNVDQETADSFLEEMRKSWESFGFKILEEAKLSDNYYFHVGFRSIFFRLKSLR